MIHKLSINKGIYTSLNRKKQFKQFAKCIIFGHAIHIIDNVKLIGNKYVFVRKYNKNNKIIRYRIWLVTQGFSQRLKITLIKLILL